MPTVYSVYEAKARFSEILRRVRAGQRVRISYRGQEIAEIGPIDGHGKSLDDRLDEMEREGGLTRARRTHGALRPVARRPGALARFLENRE